MTSLFFSIFMIAQLLSVSVFNDEIPQAEDVKLEIRSNGTAETRHKIGDFKLGKKTKDKNSAFEVNGANQSDLIAELTSLNGIPIDEIERQLRSEESGSDAALLGASESLLQLLAKDNETVVGHGLTHQQLAAPLLIFDQLQNQKDRQTGTINFGTWFHSKRDAKITFGASPFLSPDLNKRQCRKINLTRGYSRVRARLKYKTRMAHAIFSHGFYGGEDSPDRVSPEEIIEFFSPRILKMFDLEPAGQEKKNSLLRITANKKFNSELTLADFDFGKPGKDKDTEFVLNAKNETSLIQNLPTIAGKTILDLEKQMRPGAAGEQGSVKGFLGPKESLLDVMAKDNQLVVEKHGLTHQQLAAPLLILNELDKKKKQSGVLIYGKSTFYIGQFRSSNGYQHSPFGDELKTSHVYTVVNTSTNKKLQFSPLVPMMIYRYGFYEGLGTPYRVPPEKIIDFFGKDLLKSIVVPPEN